MTKTLEQLREAVEDAGVAIMEYEELSDTRKAELDANYEEAYKLFLKRKQEEENDYQND